MTTINIKDFSKTFKPQHFEVQNYQTSWNEVEHVHDLSPSTGKPELQILGGHAVAIAQQIEKGFAALHQSASTLDRLIETSSGFGYEAEEAMIQMLSQEKSTSDFVQNILKESDALNKSASEGFNHIMISMEFFMKELGISTERRKEIQESNAKAWLKAFPQSIEDQWKTHFEKVIETIQKHAQTWTMPVQAGQKNDENQNSVGSKPKI